MVIKIPRDYGYGKTRRKKIGNFTIEIEFPVFKKARFTVYEGNDEVYWSGSDSLSSNKEKVLDRYRSLNTVKSIRSFIKKRNKIK